MTPENPEETETKLEASAVLTATMHAGELAARLNNVVDAYLSYHHDVTPAEVRQALHNVQYARKWSR